MSDLPDAPAARRNSGAILEVLRIEFAAVRSVLEIGSGTGQHAVAFGEALSWLSWQPSDCPGNLDGIRRRVAVAGLGNVNEPVRFDVERDAVPAGDFDAAFSANTAHIMHLSTVEAMFAAVGGMLAPGGHFCLYGPFRINGEFTADSNAQFDVSLRRRDPGMGVRDLDRLHEFAATAGLASGTLYAMPSNNFVQVWSKYEQ